MSQLGSLNATLCAGLAQGGISHYTYALAGGLQGAGVNTTVLMYSYPEYDLADYPHRHRFAQSLLLGGATSRSSLYISPFRNLYELARTARSSDVVHFQWSLGRRNDRLQWPLLHRLGKPIVYTAHDVLPHEPDIMSAAHSRWIYDTADGLVVHGEQLKHLLVERFGVLPERVHVIPHGNYNFVADTPGPWDRTSARASFGWSEDDRVLLFFGLIREYKGLDVLLSAVGMIRDRGLPGGQRLRLLIAGRPFRNHWAEGGYDDFIRRANLSDYVQLHLEHIDMREIPRFFRAADVLAVPYRRGSQSGVLHLAYAFGMPAVASRVGSIAERDSCRAAQFVAPGDPEALAEALGDLLTDSAAAEQLGRRARHFSDTELAWDAIAHKTRSLYESLL